MSGPVFKAVAGRTRRNTGIASALCRPCSEVRPLLHDYKTRLSTPLPVEPARVIETRVMGNFRSSVLPWLLAASTALAITGGLRTAHADAAAAEALFREGKKLMAEDKIPQACEKFAASQKLDPSSGTLLNLADCHTKNGATASAWAEFLAAARMSKNQGDQARADESTRRAKALEPQLSYLSLKIAAPTPGLSVKRDDVVIEEAALSADIPVDPGNHMITATAPGYKTWSKQVSIGAAHDRKEMVIPALEKDPTAAAVPTASAPSSGPAEIAPAPPTRSPTVGYVVGGAGIVLTGVGAIFGLKALSTYKDAESDCNGQHTACPQSSADKKSTAGTQANIANVGIGLGIVGIGVGTYLVLTSRSPAKTTGTNVTVTPLVGASSGGAAVSGQF
jgi:hypothetical protein